MIQASLGSASASCSSRISKPIIRPLLEVIANYDVAALRVSLQGMGWTWASNSPRQSPMLSYMLPLAKLLNKHFQPTICRLGNKSAG
jgi:hypothetical protein